MQLCIIVPDRSNHLWIERALRWSSDGWWLVGEVMRLFQLHLAVMLAIAPTAGWKVRA